jgi:hypothetical protein
MRPHKRKHRFFVFQDANRSAKAPFMNTSNFFLLSFVLPELGITEILEMQSAQWSSMQKAGMIEDFEIASNGRSAWVVCSDRTPEEVYVRMLQWPIRALGLPEVKVLEHYEAPRVKARMFSLN